MVSYPLSSINLMNKSMYSVEQYERFFSIGSIALPTYPNFLIINAELEIRVSHGAPAIVRK